MVARAVEYTIVVSSLRWATTSCGEGSSVHCPFCSNDESKVVDSRESESGDAIRRRRECLACERRYTTYERLEEVPLVVVKRSGSEEVFAQQAVEKLLPREHLLAPAALDDHQGHFFEPFVGRVATLAGQALSPPADGVARFRVAGIDDFALVAATERTMHG